MAKLKILAATHFINFAKKTDFQDCIFYLGAVIETPSMDSCYIYFCSTGSCLHVIKMAKLEMLTTIHFLKFGN
jgi:hypothetical protein